MPSHNQGQIITNWEWDQKKPNNQPTNNKTQQISQPTNHTKKKKKDKIKQETEGEELSQEEIWWKVEGHGVSIGKEVAEGWGGGHWVPRALVGAAWCAGLCSEIEAEEGVDMSPSALPTSGTLLAIMYPPPGDMGGQLGQGQEDTVEERSHDLVETTS